MGLFLETCLDRPLYVPPNLGINIPAERADAPYAEFKRSLRIRFSSLIGIIYVEGIVENNFNHVCEIREGCHLYGCSSPSIH